MRRICASCSPSILGFVAFLFSFPLGRPLPILSSWTLFDLFFMFFLFVPAFTIGALVLTIMYTRNPSASTRSKLLAWIVLTLTVAINAFTVMGVLAAAYY